MVSSGAATSSSSTADRVTTLLAEPGSNTDVKAALAAVGRGGSSSMAGPMLAMARISPETGSITTAIPPAALVADTCAANDRSTSYWRERSMVSTRSSPRVAGRRCWSPPAMVLPSEPRSTSSSPGSPASRPSYWSSRPDRPWLSTSTWPSTEPARSPAGRNRRGSSSRATPSISRADTASALSSSTWRAR